ncbi:hypothetical protein HNR42_002178 [Deinobacterium chartae]|uniref:Phosphodiester glycosidase domain-containing protein n=1 Tax=Deinobacterium chartae TaxID=521158 RepID=A0A841I0L5_9DEIO|nr:phosphodiester glycosidase family protein [Deinobacterium chartae]MBB6098743.1 hypothetical protein [Deinobacterium chartae]
MKRFFIGATLICALLASAEARPVWIGGVPTSPVIETKLLPSGREGLPVWFLPRLGISIRNSPQEVVLQYGQLTLRYTPETGWGNYRDLGAPEVFNNSVHVPVDVLRILGLPLLADAPEVLDVAVPAQVPAPPAASTTAPLSPAPAAPTRPATGATQAPPAPAPPPLLPVNPVLPAPQLITVRRSLTQDGDDEVSRLVFEFSSPAEYRLEQAAGVTRLTVLNARGSARTENLPGEGSYRYRLTPQGQHLFITLDTRANARTEVFTLQDPFRIVLDTRVRTKAEKPPAADVKSLPGGVRYRQLDKLQMLVFESGRYQPRIITAARGESRAISDYVHQTGAVAAVNGGYFDPKSALPVDLVALGGQMISASLERRATIGFSASGAVSYGVPKPRYRVTSALGTVTVNTVRSKPNAKWLTLFVGDGHTRVGGVGFVTLTVSGPQGGVVTASNQGTLTPPRGAVTLTFDPARFPQLPLEVGASLALTLDWAAEGWDGIQEALAAGPRLVAGGQYAVNPVAEGFDTRTNVWRPTRQVAFGTMPDGDYVIAYLEWGTPEDFARALQKVGVRDALRLDSGTSAAVYVGGGYFNRVWSRAVPNAIVVLPRKLAASR